MVKWIGVAIIASAILFFLVGFYSGILNEKYYFVLIITFIVILFGIFSFTRWEFWMKVVATIAMGLAIMFLFFYLPHLIRSY